MIGLRTLLRCLAASLAPSLGLMTLSATAPAVAITINIEYSDEGDTPPHPENPSWDPSGLILKAHFQAAKQIWETLLPDAGVYEFDFQWDDDIGDDTLGLATDLGVLDVFIEINPNFNWYADSTPGLDEEFDFSGQQQLYGQLSSADQTTYFPGAAPPDALEVRYRGLGSPAAASASGQVGVTAATGFDLLSVILHEMGHILGVYGLEPGDYNIDPLHVGGLLGVVVLAEGGAHLGGNSATPGFLMNPGTPPGARYRPSATDVLVIAEDQGYTGVYLERVGSISSGLWSVPGAWIGGAAPDIAQEASIRHGGQVALDNDAQARNLQIAGGSSLAVYSNHLIVDGGLLFDWVSCP